MKIIPVAGREIRDPESLQLLPAEGREVPDGDLFWTRRILDGDVTVEGAEPQQQDKPAPAKEA